MYESLRKESRNIVIIMPSLHKGGAEKFVASLVTNLIAEGWIVKLIVFRRHGSYMHLLPEGLDIQVTNSERTLFALPHVLYRLWRIRPSVVFSSLTTINLLLSFFKFLFFPRSKLVVREVNIPSLIVREEKHTGIFRWLYGRMHKSVDLVICQSSDMKQDLLDFTQLGEDQTIVVNNGVDVRKLRNLSLEQNVIREIAPCYVLAVGSLEYRKGFDLLIEAWSGSEFHGRGVQLIIIGEGSLRDDLSKRIKDLNCEGMIHLLGYVSNPYPLMRGALCAVISSRYEGFPNFAIEALALGAPLVGFRSPGGVNEIVTEGVNGALVEVGDIEGLRSLLSTKTLEPFVRDDVQKSGAKFTIEETQAQCITRLNQLLTE